MPRYCAVLGCRNRWYRGSAVRFYSFPSYQNRQRQIESERIKRRACWAAALRRGDFSEAKIKSASICSAHFVTGRPADTDDVNHPDWVPSLNMGYVPEEVLKEEDLGHDDEKEETAQDVKVAFVTPIKVEVKIENTEEVTD